MKQYEMFELTLYGDAPAGSEALADIEAVFSCEGEEQKIRGFYDGDGCYKIRYLPRKCGVYTWSITGEISAEGQEECIAGDAHGIVKAEQCHFRYEDGTAYIPFGTTVYALVHQKESIIEETIESLKQSPFNKVRHCVFPKDYLYNKNDPEYYPFRRDSSGKWDVHHPDPEFWRRLEMRIMQLGAIGIETDLILFHPYDRWGFSRMSRQENETYLRYALRRLSAIPCIWWSLANEYDLCFVKTEEEWHHYEEIIKEEDPYGHLLSIHYCMKFYDYARENLTHCSMQNILFYKASEWMKQFNKPVVYDECCYEGDICMPWGNISAEEMVHRFWCAYCSGAYATHGETYLSDDDVLWWSKGGKLKGKSVAGIAFLREIMEELPLPLEYWDEPEIPTSGEAITEERQQEIQRVNELRQALSSMESDAVELKDKPYTGHCGDDVFIKYLGIQRPAVTFLSLPDNGTYMVEVIDTRECTKKVIADRVSGVVWLKLSAEVGLALLAKRCSPDAGE